MGNKDSKAQFERAVYIDLEWNCWDSRKATTQHREIIEIGAVEMNLETLDITLERDYLIRPRPFDISDRCTAITGLNAADLKGSPTFPEVLARFEQDFSPKESMCCTWGHDSEFLAEACGRYKLRSPLRNCVDVASLFWHNFLLRSQPSLRAAIQTLGIDFDGVAHTALADARNTAKIHAAMIRRIRGISDPVPAHTTVVRDACPATLFGEKLSRALVSASSGLPAESSGLGIKGARNTDDILNATDTAGLISGFETDKMT